MRAAFPEHTGQGAARALSTMAAMALNGPHSAHWYS
jgi:hypothetical protein